jgi:hypothetical protein
MLSDIDEDNMGVNEYHYKLNDYDKVIQEETVDTDRGEGKEGGIHKNFFCTVGSVA